LTLSALLLAFLGTTVIAVAPASAATITDTWTGATATTATNPSYWGTPTNWAGSAAPGATDAVSFPVLSSECNTTTTSKPIDTCYTSHNDSTGLTPSQLSIETNNSSTPGLLGVH
jgi:hypothetical protein